MKNLDDGIRFPGFLPKKTGFNRTGFRSGSVNIS
jgi:hypothetical protein